MVRKVANQPKRHSQRVAAWIYAVINPVSEGLQRELEFLEHGNATWRHYSQRCEFIRPVQEYCDSTQWPNYSDFLVENPEFEAGFFTHDNNLDGLNNSASALFGALISDPQFVRSFDFSYQAYEERRAQDSRLTDLTHLKPELHKLMAEYLINNIQVLPNHYVTAKFWDVASSTMLDLRSSSNFQPVGTSEAMLKSTSQELSATLQARRLDFSRTFDLPAAPIPNYLHRR